MLPNGASRWILCPRRERRARAPAPATGHRRHQHRHHGAQAGRGGAAPEQARGPRALPRDPGALPARAGRARAARPRHALPARQRVPARHHRARRRGACRTPIFEILPDLRESLEPVLRQVLETRRADAQHRDRGRHAAPPGGQGVVEVPRLPSDRRLRRDARHRPRRRGRHRPKRAEHARDLLGRELSHRIKNLFAVVSSIVSLSARGNDAVKDFARTIRGRIEALGRAHDYVRPAEWERGGDGAPRSLHELLAAPARPLPGRERRAHPHRLRRARDRRRRPRRPSRSRCTSSRRTR